MKRSGASLLVYALEQIGVNKTFGIPGIHNAEIYNLLSDSKFIEPVIVTHELSAGYMADAVSRTTNSIGTMVIVPGAGLTHAMSAIAEAFVDGIPLLVISGGINHEAGKSFQMHHLDMEQVTNGLVKSYCLINEPSEVVPKVYEAYNNAISGEPGPVLIEIPIKTQLMQTSEEPPRYTKLEIEGPFAETSGNLEGTGLGIGKKSNAAQLDEAIDLIFNAANPGIYVGWGAKNATAEIDLLSQLISAPVATTIQGISTFPADKLLHTGIGLGDNASLAAQNAFKGCDCLIAIGVKFSELATCNYQLEVPESLIHIDIHPIVFGRNYPAQITIIGDAKLVVIELIKRLESTDFKPIKKLETLASSIKKDKEEYKKTWFIKPGESMVTPGFFFNALRSNLPDDLILTTDDGNHMLMTAELFPVHQNGLFLCPTDYSAMGYGIPAAIGAKLMERHRVVATIVSDGGLLMTGNELVNAYRQKIGLLVFVFRDVRSLQIIEKQKETNPRASIDQIGAIDLEGFASGVRARFLKMKTDIDISGVLTQAKELMMQSKTVIIEVNIDYSRKTSFAESLIKPKANRISFTDKIKLLFKSKN